MILTLLATQLGVKVIQLSYSTQGYRNTCTSNLKKDQLSVDATSNRWGHRIQSCKDLDIKLCVNVERLSKDLN